MQKDKPSSKPSWNLAVIPLRGRGALYFCHGYIVFVKQQIQILKVLHLRPSLAVRTATTRLWRNAMREDAKDVV
jgi:hypothetical protein